MSDLINTITDVTSIGDSNISKFRTSIHPLDGKNSQFAITLQSLRSRLFLKYLMIDVEELTRDLHKSDIGY